MVFFDLNIPYRESDRHVTEKSKFAFKSNRLKLAVKAAEFGYTGVAYNREFRGVMSESDRCSTPPFPLSSLLKASPALSSSVKFHRELLSVPVSAPFRQYTRLTVAVDSAAQAAALNSGNPVLKSYDIVALRPLNQNAFEQACQTSEVDIISIDFSEKLPFRLKQPMVQAAIKRGVYFEISYSGIITDAESRKQIISNAKLLVDWTRRKNLIVSSAAPSASELRGPYDVANLLSLLGLPFGHAKAAISKNCRSVLSTALRKKHYYKDAIKVEFMPSSGKVDSENPAFSDWLKWDPISSGEGDLLFDDIEKFFSSSGSMLSNTVNTVRLNSALNSLPPHGLQLKEKLSTEKCAPKILDGGDLSVAKESQVAVAVHETSGEPCGHNLQHADCQTFGIIGHKSPSHLDSEISTLPSSAVNDSTRMEENGNNMVAVGDLGSLKELDPCLPISNAELHSLCTDTCLDNSNGVLLLPNEVTNQNLSKDTELAQTCVDIASAETCTYSKDTGPSFYGVESEMPLSSPIEFCQENILVDKGKSETAIGSQKNPPFALSDVFLDKELRDITQVEENPDISVTSDDEFSGGGFNNHFAKKNELLVSEVEPIQEDILEEQREIKDQVALSSDILGKTVPGRRRVKRRAGYHYFPFSLNRFLNLPSFKKKRRLKS